MMPRRRAPTTQRRTQCLKKISELRALVTRLRWGLFAGLAILVIVVIAATLWLDQPETAVGGPVERVMAMVMLLAVILSLFMMLTVERLFRDMRTGAVPITSIVGGLQIIGGILFFATRLLAADGLLEQVAARAQMPPEQAARVSLHVWPLPLELPLFIGALALFAIGRAVRRAAVLTDRSQAPDLPRRQLIDRAPPAPYRRRRLRRGMRWPPAP